MVLSESTDQSFFSDSQHFPFSSVLNHFFKSWKVENELESILWNAGNNPIFSSYIPMGRGFIRFVFFCVACRLQHGSWVRVSPSTVALWGHCWRGKVLTRFPEEKYKHLQSLLIWTFLSFPGKALMAGSQYGGMELSHSVRFSCHSQTFYRTYQV